MSEEGGVHDKRLGCRNADVRLPRTGQSLSHDLGALRSAIGSKRNLYAGLRSFADAPTSRIPEQLELLGLCRVCDFDLTSSYGCRSLAIAMQKEFGLPF